MHYLVAQDQAAEIARLITKLKSVEENLEAANNREKIIIFIVNTDLKFCAVLTMKDAELKERKRSVEDMHSDDNRILSASQ